MTEVSQAVLQELEIDLWVPRGAVCADTPVVWLESHTTGGIIVISNEAYAKWSFVKYLLKNISRYLTMVSGLEFAILRPAMEEDQSTKGMAQIVTKLKPRWVVNFGTALSQGANDFWIDTRDLNDLLANGLLKAEVMRDVARLGL